MSCYVGMLLEDTMLYSNHLVVRLRQAACREAYVVEPLENLHACKVACELMMMLLLAVCWPNHSCQAVDRGVQLALYLA